jgi:hypothetical protein
VNGVDPTGKFVIACLGFSLSIATTVRVNHTKAVTIAGSYASTKLFSFTIPMYMARVGVMLSAAFATTPIIENAFWGFPHLPTTAEKNKITAAENIIKATPLYKRYYGSFYGIYNGTTETTYAGTDVLPWGNSPKVSWYSLNTSLWLHKKAIELPDILLASLIVHEATHAGQFFLTKGNVPTEKAAYEIQSDFLKLHGITGQKDDVMDRIINANPSANRQAICDFINDVESCMREYGVQNPALTEY